MSKTRYFKNKMIIGNNGSDDTKKNYAKDDIEWRTKCAYYIKQISNMETSIIRLCRQKENGNRTSEPNLKERRKTVIFNSSA